MSMHIALAGNPNCGKTTMFNDLTGSSQYVGNWPGVTVEKKEGRLKGSREIVIQDLPGIYSLSPYTLEEVVSRNYLITNRPDAILNIVDATNIERNLYLTTQLLELGIPVVVALNMIDVVRKAGDKIDVNALSATLGCPVIETSALKGEGSAQAAARAAELAGKAPTHTPVAFEPGVETALEQIGAVIDGKCPEHLRRWFAVKLFERDEKAREQIQLRASDLAAIEQIVKAAEDELDDDSESIITNQRYVWISGVMKKCVRKKAAHGSLSLSDKIDRIVTNRILALPIFACVMFAIYAIAMGGFSFSIGTIGTDFANDVIFGEWVPGFFDSFLLNGAGEPVVAEWLYGLIQDGIVAGVGAVLGFVPQILVLFFLLSILEDIGYMARVAFIMDRIFRKFGLSGKSFIPMLVATGCGVPGIMASRT
ncbi:MAG: ferrous iron transport protein B, partial [Butyricicoccaceae bacterium]